MCCLLGVSRSAYYDWLKTHELNDGKQDFELTTIINSVFIKSRATYGTRRLKKELVELNKTVSRRRIGRLMKENNLACKTKRKFKAIDLYSRHVVGWSMAEHMRTQLVNDALLMAIWKRKPASGLIWHTDRGSQYASESHRLLLAQHGIQQSMSRKGNCWDNAVAESFFHTLKTELINHESYQTRSAARLALFEYIEVFYNRQRRHSANGYLSPVNYELQQIVA